MFDSHTDHNIFFRSNNYDYNHEINKAYIECLKNASPFKLYFAGVLFAYKTWRVLAKVSC